MVIEAKILGNTFETAYQENAEISPITIAENNADNKQQSYYSQIEDKFVKSSLPAIDDYKSKMEKTAKDKQEKSPIGEKSSEKTDEEKKASGELTDQEKKVVEDLKARDNAVRTHEQAHLAAGAGLVKSGASYSYQTGPDNKRYAIGGEVQIDISPVDGDPQATILKMQQVKAAAMAPSDPSSQDRSVAATASRIESQARAELNSQNSQQNIQNLKKYGTIDSASLKKIYGNSNQNESTIDLISKN